MKNIKIAIVSANNIEHQAVISIMIQSGTHPKEKCAGYTVLELIIALAIINLGDVVYDIASQYHKHSRRNKWCVLCSNTVRNWRIGCTT